VLNSHSDVVPAVTESWTKDPYGGIIENGNICGVS
jgi:acetylornithine deacetylase/succinyl-diaminopimelate desuccinylase-like protein